MSNIIVFGATGGIGSEVVRRLHAAGHQVFLVARDATRLEALGAETGFAWKSADITQSAEVDACFAEAISAMGGIDGVLHCVGSILLKPAHLTTDEEWATTISVNLSSAFFCVRAAAKAMRANGGSVVLCSSVAARRGLMNHDAIAAAKAGIIGLTLSAAATYAPSIRVNAVAPALVRTPLTAGLTGNDSLAKASAAMHPLKRLGEPEDVAPAIVWLLSGEAAWVTGQVIGIDGGMGSIQTRS